MHARANEIQSICGKHSNDDVLEDLIVAEESTFPGEFISWQDAALGSHSGKSFHPSRVWGTVKYTV